MFTQQQVLFGMILVLALGTVASAFNQTNGNVVDVVTDAGARLAELDGALAAFPDNDVIVLETVYQLKREYRTGALRQASRALKSLGGEADRIGQAIEQICIDQQRNVIRLWDVGTDNDAIELRDRVRGRIAQVQASIATFKKNYVPPANGNGTDAGTPVLTGQNGQNGNGAGTATSPTQVGLLGLETGPVTGIGQGTTNPDGAGTGTATGTGTQTGQTGLQFGVTDYVVQSGDSVWKIADRLSQTLGVPREQLITAIQQVNYLGTRDIIHEGQTLRLPVLSDMGGNRLIGDAAQTALNQWTQTYQTGRVFAGADANTDQFASDINTQLRNDLRRAYDTFYGLGCTFAQVSSGTDAEKAAIVEKVRAAAQNYVGWARQRYLVLKNQITSMPAGADRDTAVANLRRLATVGRCADNLQYARAEGWRFDFCNQQIADLVGAAGV